MPQSLPSSELHRFARLGAQVRLDALEQERAAILRAFPDLDGARAPRKDDGSAVAPRQLRRRRMSAAQKRAVSERMKKYWASRREAKRGGAEAAGRGSKGPAGRKSRKKNRRTGKQ